MKPDASHGLDLETVFEAVGIEAEMESIAIISLLEGNGIPAVLVGSPALPTLPFQVKTPRDQAEQARRCIAESQAAGPAGADEAEEVVIDRTPGLIEKAVPVLPALDLAETRGFYTRLGFQVVNEYPGHGYLIVERDGVELHFSKCNDPAIPENTSCYIRVHNATALHAEFSMLGLDKLSPVEAKPWIMLEFHLIDPNGNLLRIGQRG